MNQINQTSSTVRLLMGWQKTTAIKTCLQFARLMLVAVALTTILAQSAQAQTARFRSPVHRVTVPLNYNGSFVFTNICTVSGLVNPAELTITGLPAGATATITATNGALPLGLNSLPSTLITTNLLITLTLNGTVAQGLYPLNLNASSGATNNWAFDLQVASMWSGANYLAGINTNWNDGGNWVSGAAPGANDDVVFGQSGATNANTITNVSITSSTVISSLRFSQTNSTFKHFTLQLDPGVTLGVGGAKGFSVMKDVLNSLTGLGGMNVTMRGESATLAVTNPAANVLIGMADNGQAGSLDLTSLGAFVTDVNQFALGDYYFFPNYRNYNAQNSYGGTPRQFLASMNMARTNVIKARYADPFNSTNADERHFSFSYLNTEIAGSTTVQNLNFGISNVFYVDSINFGGGNSRGNAQFNTIFAASNPIAIFRGTNGGRMSVFAIADGAGTNTSQTSPNNNVSFLQGTVDILADRFYIGRDRKLIPAGQNPSYVGNFFMGKGAVDAKTVILGYREYNQTNAPLGQVSLGYCVGRITVSNTAVFKASESIWLGSTVANHPNEESTGGNTDQGQISLINGGQLFANTILVGGPAYGYSRNNMIFVTNGSSITVSNRIAGPDQSLDFMTFANGSTLSLTLNATNTLASVYATNFNMVGSNSLVITAIKNPGSLVNGLQIPLFKRSAGGAPNFTVFNLSGVNGQVVTDGGDPNQQNFQVILNTPKNLIWKGYSSATWDNTTANWLDTVTLLHTNFAAGDSVKFDDSASQFSISLDSGSVILPGSIAMANTNNGYTINNTGGGSIIGSATLTKTGTNGLVVDGPTSVSVVLNAGSLSGSGSLASATINSGAEMNFTGSIGGNLTVAGIATSSGTVNGVLLVQNGGVVTNVGTMNSTFAVGSGGLLVNNPFGNFANIGLSSVSAGAVMVNRGSITGQGFDVSGTFKDTGEGVTTLKGTLTANAGSLIIPGGDGIGTTTVLSGSAAGFPGRVLLALGSTNILKVDIIGAVNTKLLSGYQDFGGSASARTQNGCTLVITNVSGSFTAGQVFNFFQYSGFGGGNPTPTGTSTNTYPVIVPATPGAGLAWDLTQLWPSGSIGVVAASSGPSLTNSFTVLGGTNIIGQFDWPSANQGYSLQTLVTPIDVGLAIGTNYNWTRVSGSWTNTTVLLTNAVGTNCVFYRLAFP